MTHSLGAAMTGNRGRAGSQNSNWRGGEVTDPRGYVLVRVGKGHHLADVRGYAYRHRLVAEENLGRRLLPGEEVHHRDETPGNDTWGNLEVTPHHAAHAVFHRKPRELPLRLPGEANPDVACACGCGGSFPRYDDAGRPRTFISGHNGSMLKKTRPAIWGVSVQCACGCGASFMRDKPPGRSGLPRKYIRGHSTHRGA